MIQGGSYKIGIFATKNYSSTNLIVLYIKLVKVLKLGRTN